jgi:hypothetical protein
MPEWIDRRCHDYDACSWCKKDTSGPETDSPHGWKWRHLFRLYRHYATGIRKVFSSADGEERFRKRSELRMCRD